VDQKRYINPEKPLPLSRTAVPAFEMGYQEPDPKRVATGKITLRQAIKFISDHQTEPNEWTAERIAKEYKMKQENVENILENFRMFAIYIPKEEGKTKKFLIDPKQQKSTGFEALLDDLKGRAVKEEIERKRLDHESQKSKEP
jgi:ribonucleotide reductase alpha subunit